ncbi:MAG TPA: alkylhydroperoxidase domain protein [Candidatus Dormibacteraeota bacterium]
MTDVLNALAGIAATSPVLALRQQRHEATAHAQGSYDALFRPPDPGGVGSLERAAVALRVAAWHDEAGLVDHYRQLLSAAGEGGEELAGAIVTGAGGAGGVAVRDGGGDLAARLRAELDHADLLATHPVDARPEHLAALTAAGLTVRDIVTVSQLIAFVSFQARVLAGLLLLAGTPSSRSAPPAGPRIRTAMARRAFTQEELEWTPWVEPLSLDDTSPEQREALGARASSPYFRLLAHDAPVLVERTATDVGVFRSELGLARAERELGAAVASRVNGCVYCASVHARFASHFSGRRADVQRLLDEGVEAAQDERWRAVIDFAAALSQTPSRADESDLARLRALGYGDLEILDLAQATAFFAWANRLMLTLGEPAGGG